MDNRARCALIAALSFAIAGFAVSATPARTTLGQAADKALVERENIDVSPDGAGLPPGSGDAAQGKLLFAASCSRCHGSALMINPERWAYATTLFDYVRRAMPPTTRTKLSAPEVYALVAYLLAENSFISKRAIMNASSLPAVRMPRVDDFVPVR